MDHTSMKQRYPGIGLWPWIVGITVLFVTCFFPPLPIPTDAWGIWKDSYEGAFWQVLHSMVILPQFWRYYLTHDLGNIVFNYVLPLCGFPILWSVVSAGMWRRLVKREPRPTARRGMWALFLANVIAWLISSVVLLVLFVVLANTPVPGSDGFGALVPIIVGVKITLQAVLYLPWVLLAGALLAKFQARIFPTAHEPVPPFTDGATG